LFDPEKHPFERFISENIAGGNAQNGHALFISQAVRRPS
jgi:hypothetical protein